MMNLTIYSIILIIFLINKINCEEHDYDCAKLNKYNSFQSHLIFNYNHIRNGKSYSKNYAIKETFYRNREKLEINSLDGKENKIFNFDFDRDVMYEQDIIKNTCKISRIGSAMPDIGVFVFKDPKHNFFGPTALFFENADKKMVYSGYKKIRNIKVQKCYIYSSDAATTFRIYLIRKYYKIDNSPILKMTYKKEDLSDFRSDYYEIDYIKLRRLNDDEDLDYEDERNEKLKDFWHLPDYCIEKNYDGIEYPRDEFKLSKQYEFKLQELINQQTKLTKLTIDTENEMLMIKNFESNNEIVLDLKNKINYKLNEMNCLKEFKFDYRNLKSEKDKEFYDLVYLAIKLKEIDKFNYIGIRECREFNCDTFSFYSKDNNYNDDHQTLFTFFFKYDESIDQHNLIHIKKQSIKLDDNGVKNLISTIVYEVYDFKNIENNYKQLIDLTDCSYEDEHKMEISLNGLVDGSFKLTSELESETINKIIELTKLNHYNLPRIDTTIDSNSVKMFINLIQPINDLYYYIKFNDDYSIPLDRLKFNYAKKSLEECATIGVKNKWLGMQYCSDQLECYSIDDEKLFKLNKKETENNNCRVFRREMNQNYITLPESIKLIEKSIANRKFELSNGFNFKSLDNSYEFNHIDKDNLFNLVDNEKCLNDKKIKNLNCKLRTKFSDCIFNCQSTNCNLFSVQKIDKDQLKCCFINDTFDELKRNYEYNYLTKDNKCSLYELSYLNKFTRLSDKTINSKPIITIKNTTPENCAINCLKHNNNDKLKCLSFSYCLSKEDHTSYLCELRDYNQFVLNDKTTKLIDSHSCTLYSANFLIDYHKTEFKKLKNAKIFKNYNLQECAHSCKGNKDCSKFNFCKNNGDMTCQLEQSESSNEKDDNLDYGICTSYLNNKYLILDELVKDKKIIKSRNFFSWYYLVSFSIGLILSTLIMIGRKAMEKRKLRLNNNDRGYSIKYFSKFEEEDRINLSISSE